MESLLSWQTAKTIVTLSMTEYTQFQSVASHPNVLQKDVKSAVCA